MENRITALEDQMGDVKDMLKALIDKMHTQNLAIVDLSKQVGKNHGELMAKVSSGDSSQSESRLAGKKVKLPLFEGDDPVAWITRAEIYFDVQNTTDDSNLYDVFSIIYCYFSISFRPITRQKPKEAKLLVQEVKN
ncbi:hypothetical protein QL285_069477 [Trifolium repens]|nr:hypothetical protein QL285_069477 [Trifolium repens]